ncbi:molybdopterin-guanine dinucleotide biosynthesis protein B [Sulfurovum sp.]|uniref:molybdopterin-guanine dinucleotide biosynthesis protein B n=1 Tax=Sulfurovum sp. TaxID=1969726 RepID=UPI0025E5F518|nr:molybdopterin-guanine dinucleotide biosynthesis protein B [Sulfurovum sp.]
MKNRVAVAFTGPSGSGKTTLVQKVSSQLIKTQKVAIIKNDPKDKAVFDVEGKDSHKFYQTGAEVVVTSPTRTTYFSQREKSLAEIVAMINDFDILLVEGLKTLPLPRIAIFRTKIDESYFDCSEAIAIDDTIDPSVYAIPDTIDILDLNDLDQIIDWIKTHAISI